jgi:O-antigen biosynthesis protein WbqP
MKRTFDLLITLISLIFFFPILIVLFFIVKFTSKGPALYWSDRVGKDNKIFRMVKFRTMYVETPDVATHLLGDTQSYITPIGKFLRKTSLDELPQLWNILIGDMSFVGPRPALYNQDDLIKLRTDNKVSTLIPGLTGWAQINGRDEISIPEKVKLDEFYLLNQSFSLDMNILVSTFLSVIKAKDVSH